MSTRKQMTNAMKTAKKYSSYFGGDSDNENMSGGSVGGDDRDPEVDYDDYESEAEDDSVSNDNKTKPNDGDGEDVADEDSGVEDSGEDEEDEGDEDEEVEGDEDEEELDEPIDTEDEDEDEDEDEVGEDEEGNIVVTPTARKPVPARNKKPVQTQVNVYSKSDDSEGDEDEDEDENYLQKFNAEINKEYIVDYHPECIISNYDEVATLAVVVRDKNGIIIDDLHRTPPYLTKYERARILGQRAKQINAGAPVYVKVPEKVIDGYLIAELELRSKLIPYIIRRPLPNGGSEYWRLSELENVAF